MATESPIRLIETNGNWPSSTNMATEDLGFLLKTQRFQGNNRRDSVPNRSGSAPPSMEGSFAAIENLISQQNFTSNAVDSYESEEQLRADPAYFTYYWSNVNLNPRLPPPIISGENRRLIRHIGSTGNGLRLTSFDDISNGSIRVRLGNLPTHKEESEDDRSPHQGTNEWASSDQLKSLVELIQDNFPRTPSPVYNQSRALSHESIEEAINYVADPPTRTPTAISSTPSADNTGESSYSDPATVPISSSSYLDSTRGIEFGMDAINISRTRNSENQKNQKHSQHVHQMNMPQEQLSQQQSHPFQVVSPHPQMIPQGIGLTYIGTDQLHQGSSNFSMTSANPFHPNLQPSGYFSPQYNVGGYSFNPPALSPYVAGYLPPSPSTLGSTADGVDMQHLNRFYGQFGFPMQPSFTDPLHTQYYQQTFGGAYNVSGRLGHLASISGSGGSQVGALDSREGSEAPAYSIEQKLQNQGGGAHRSLNPRGVGITSPYYLGSPTNMGILQFPSSPVASPVLPGSPIGGTSFFGGRSELRFPQSRNPGIYSGLQGQRGIETFDGSKTVSFLEELKAGKGRRLELSDIAGHIIEFSVDQHGSRFIQQKLESCRVEEKQSVFTEVIPHASKLMIDVFGNYVIQKFFEYGSPEQRKELANQLEGQILPLSLQMYGCRVIQKALDVIELEQKTKLVHELDGHVMRCVRDQNGNHVIQKCIESIPTEKIEFIISSFRGQVATLSTHPYGCRVIQRVLEHCTDELQSQFIVDEILESVCSLAQDQYGNYVTQHVLERGNFNERSQIISKLSGRIVQLSQHKFASNVVEKCLEYGDPATRDILIGEIVGVDDENDNLLTMVKDQYANYVVQRILQTCTGDQREMLLSRIRIHLNSLKKYTYGKHIVARFEHLYGEELQDPNACTEHF